MALSLRNDFTCEHPYVVFMDKYILSNYVIKFNYPLRTNLLAPTCPIDRNKYFVFRRTSHP